MRLESAFHSLFCLFHSNWLLLRVMQGNKSGCLFVNTVCRFCKSFVFIRALQTYRHTARTDEESDRNAISIAERYYNITLCNNLTKFYDTELTKHCYLVFLPERRTFAVLHSTYSRWVTTYVGKPSVVGQPTRPTQPFILLG